MPWNRCWCHRSGQRPDWRHFLHDVINVMIEVMIDMVIGMMRQNWKYMVNVIR